MVPEATQPPCFHLHIQDVIGLTGPWLHSPGSLRCLGQLMPSQKATDT